MRLPAVHRLRATPGHCTTCQTGRGLPATAGQQVSDSQQDPGGSVGERGVAARRACGSWTSSHQDSATTPGRMKHARLSTWPLTTCRET